MSNEATTFIEFNLNGGTRGLKGDKGDTGFSPTVNALVNGNQLTIEITDVNGTRSSTISIGDMFKTTYDTNNNGIVDNAELVNGHYVNKDVPADAKFTDTLYDDTAVKQSIAQANERINQQGDSVLLLSQRITNETSARENADISLQGQIDAITSASDVVDIVGTYQELQSYDTSKLSDKDVIKVLQDSTHQNALAYYRWYKSNSAFSYIGQEGPFYTKSEADVKYAERYTKTETDTLLSGKQNTLTFDSTPTANSDNPVTSKGIKTYIDGIVGDIETILETLDTGSGV